ncbi:MAG: flagellar hook-associated protein 1 [Candidatus Kapaibacterium sp.]|nr:MAG: flagellar hook-associated protein 1 [Candidatus Kapabacteria bacterium]
MIRSLEIGKRALLASQRGLDVTSNNIANVNTPGYARQAISLRPGESIPVGGTMLGMGVLVTNIRQFRDQLIERDVRTYTATQSYYQQSQTIFQRIEAALGEPGDQTIQTALQQFFDAASELASNPSRMANRQLFVSRAADLAAQFNRVSSAIADLRSSTADRTSQDIERVNQLLAKLAGINQQINATLDSSGQPAPSLVDQQHQALEELSAYLDISVTRTATGTVNVSSGGMMLVSLDSSLKLRVEKNLDSGSGATTLRISAQKQDGTIVGTLSPGSGEIAALLEHYNVTLNPAAPSSQFSVARELDRLASAFADRVNAIAAGGYGLSDSGPMPPGRPIFVAGGGPLSAGTIQLNPALASDPGLVPTASAPGEPGNNAVVSAIAALASDSSFLDTLTPEGYYGSITTQLANRGAGASDRLSAAKATLNQINQERQSLSGVNLDEEATNLITYQRAFEAAARVVTVTSDMLSTIVNLGR